MSQSFDIAVVGATGTVGETLVELLAEREFPIGTLHLLASIESAGASVPFRGKNLRVRDVAEFDFSQVRLAFFAAGEAVSRSFADRASQAGCAVIDLSGALDDAKPLVPEANAGLLGELAPPYRLSSPSASAVALACALAPLASLGIERVTVTACLAVSSRGREGVNELARQTAELLNARPLEPRFFDRQVAFNVLAQPDAVDGEGHAQLERRLARELKALLVAPALDVAATCVLVPVFFGDSLSVSLQVREDVDLARVLERLEAAPGIELVERDDYPTAVGDAVGQDVIYVGRVRKGLEDPRQVNLWIASDNVRKGAALNAVQSAELLIKHYL
ncbi:aspartate-semialdehyde dehydrogenase [Pseudomonas sp. No.21]|uniref:aspartate-semialdehyde dehydrogenase n=1 Tax=Pseudomonas TaxID=286 RepID=UPI000DAA200E|nr:MULTISPECIES: aspartate-semialdehyde dehydrogenase [Pseudomonas]MDW3713552.1 aspartate-semialdehyde dehydrogenase [Pseudomonas sp. 2023EL-01195]PZE15175.1 aspartate-semialdehyde dehydrogenase [Pseudomonas sp. 57B-090624]GJN46959.1 aspartate-semialdehyde dehydrogenase [Pseudomonas tohonis]